MIRLNQPDLKKIENIAQQMDGCISFAQGALRIGGISSVIKDYVRDILTTDKSDYYSYSLGMMSLRQKIATHLSVLNTTNLSPENIMVSHGAINGISALCLMVLDSGDEVLIPEPTYPPYFNAVALAKGNSKLVPAYRFDGTKWTFDLDLLKDSATEKTKMVIIAHPSNPSGVVLTHDQLQELSSWCEYRGIYCLVDEAYDNYFFEAPVVSSTPLVPESNFLVRIGSFSKTFGMSGWRIGYVVAQKHLIAHLAGVQDGLIVCPNVTAQYAALCALDNTFIADFYSSKVRENRDLALNLLAPLIEDGFFSCAKPTAGFFLFLKTIYPDATPLVERILASAGVALVPGRDFGPSGTPFMRLCYARDAKTLREGITRICDKKFKAELFC